MSDISIIVTTYNAEKTIKNALLSVLSDLFKDKVEVIVVDDCSSDNTVSIIEDLILKHDNLKIIQLEKNSGSPSKPRNIGINNANGEYITFLDDDDEINLRNLLDMVEYAKINDLDFVKGYLRIVRGNEIEDVGKIDCDNKDPLDVMKKIISYQSTRIDIVIKRSFIKDNDIFFNENSKVGEDTLFYADLFSCLPNIEYFNSFIHYHHKRNDIENLSTTQLYQDRELNNHLKVWELTEKKLNHIGISYYDLRLPTAIKNSINSIILFSKGEISKKCFSKFSNFINENQRYLIHKLTFHSRHEEVYQSILENDYEKFLEVSKKRLLIAGYDLKFIKSALKYLKNDYNIKIDEWIDTCNHDQNKSMELLNWADFIFCEWLLGNSVWYSHRKMSHQKLIIRAHKFELSRDYGNQVEYANVNGVIAVSYYYLEKFVNQFKIPRNKMILLGNYVENSIYTEIKNKDFKHNIAIVGYVPKWKGLLKGLKILKMLKEHDEKFRLYLIGKNYQEVDWIWNNPEERSYFRKCENFIKNYGLEDSVIFEGWMERSEIFKNVGYVLSLSDIESFHLAPAEGICDGSMAFLLDWEGVEYVYPEDIIFKNIDDMKDMILSTFYDEDKYNKLLNEMQEYIIHEFSIDKFIYRLKECLEMMILLN